MSTDYVSEAAESFYLYESAFMRLLATHSPTVNLKMKAPVRIGHGLIEYNPDLLKDYKKKERIELFKIELIRLALKHPYTRKPYNCTAASMAMGSDCAIYGEYDLLKRYLYDPAEMQLPEGESYEWYAYKITRLLNMPQERPPIPQQGDKSKNTGNGGSDRKFFDMSVLERFESLCANWEEDELQKDEVNRVLSDIMSDPSENAWGSIPRSIQEQIKASMKPKLDYRNILRSFHTSVLSSKRYLTRMKPSRRFGFEQMGAKYDLASNILVAIDVSASIRRDNLDVFLSAVNLFFRYGVEHLDLITFDTMVKDKYKFNKAKSKLKITGGGGTDFQQPIDYLKTSRTRYDGLIIFTDGVAPVPEVPKGCRTKILWVLQDKDAYERYHEALESIKPRTKSCYIN